MSLERSVFGKRGGEGHCISIKFITLFPPIRLAHEPSHRDKTGANSVTIFN